jgi:hypothetical protein
MHLSSFAAATAAVLAAAATAACGPGAPGVSATPSARPSQASPSTVPTRAPAGPLSAPDSARRIVYDESLVSDPLPASAARVSMPAGEAIKIAAASTTVGAEQQPGRPRATLRLVYPGEPSATRKVVGRPNWVLTWADSEPVIRGPVTMSEEERRRRAAALECVFVVTVDPATRTSTNALQVCVPR